jgi:hypothetical protein
MKKIKFLPSLTTVTMGGGVGDWKAQIAEIEKLNLKEFCLFPTNLEKEQRYELYNQLKTIQIEKIPLVHLRAQDMDVEELDFLIENFRVEVFNIHTTTDWPLFYDYSKHAKRIFIENCREVPTEEELSKFGGLCIDFSHWENQVKLGNLEYDKQMKDLIGKFPVGVCHLSAISEEPLLNPFKPEISQYDSHRMNKLGEMDYLKKYAQFIPTIAAIELENPIEKQLEVKEYLEKKL